MFKAFRVIKLAIFKLAFQAITTGFVKELVCGFGIARSGRACKLLLEFNELRVGDDLIQKPFLRLLHFRCVSVGQDLTWLLLFLLGSSRLNAATHLYFGISFDSSSYGYAGNGFCLGSVSVTTTY